MCSSSVSSFSLDDGPAPPAVGAGPPPAAAHDAEPPAKAEEAVPAAPPVPTPTPLMMAACSRNSRMLLRICAAMAFFAYMTIHAPASSTASLSYSALGCVWKDE